MSQSQVSDNEGSSVREMDVDDLQSALERGSQTPQSLPVDAELPDQGQDESTEERIERASELMESIEAQEIEIEVGEIVKPSEDLLIERTSEGFNAYIVSR